MRFDFPVSTGKSVFHGPPGGRDLGDTCAIWSDDGGEVVEGADELMAFVRLEVGHLNLREAAHRGRGPAVHGSAVAHSPEAVY
jgi:hypothetical protein